jgi:hypothetical protein
MRLAQASVIQIGDKRLHARATLRAASSLHEAYGGFPVIMKGIIDGSFTITKDVLMQCASDRVFPALSVAEILAPSVRIQAFDLVCALAGIDPKAKPVKADGPRITFAEYHAKLFGIATGWLGWPPEAAWNATAAEILAAYEGRGDMLRAIFGSTPDKPESPIVYDDTFDRAGLDELRALQ